MARQRMIKPEFFSSSSMSQCSIATRLAFIGLWTAADDKGNCKLEVKKLNRMIFDDDDEITDDMFLVMLAELEANKCIKLYLVDDDLFFYISNFSTYQTINRPSSSTIPNHPAGFEKDDKTNRAKIPKTRFLESVLTESDVSTEVRLTSGSLQTHSKEVIKQIIKKKGSSESADAQLSPFSFDPSTYQDQFNGGR